MKRIVRLAITACIAIGLFTLAVPSGAQVERSTYRIVLPIDWYLTPTEFPCLSETIHLFGTYEEHLVAVITNTGIGHLTLHQSTDNLTVVGLTTGKTYQESVPLTFTVSGYPTGNDFEFTFHNINHFVGPGQNDKIYLRTLEHVTFDRTTGEPKVEILKDEVLCH